MAFGHRESYDLKVLEKVKDIDLLNYYLGISNIPTIINSPLRKDSKPSFGLYSLDGNKINYTDLATADKGGVIDLLMQLWNCSLAQVLIKIEKDLPNITNNTQLHPLKPISVRNTSQYTKDIDLKCKIREWEDYDLEFWKSFGISLPWLKYAEVYPISHKIIIKEEKTYTLPADKYAYVYVEHKEGKITLKIYQPFNKEGYKWASKHDRSVISLWTKVPKYGDKICICSSLKDALCLWENTGIPCIAVQGEGYTISETAVKDLKKRYKQIFICFDNDPPGLLDARKLAEKTNFINVVLPSFKEGKDVSDLYKSLQDKKLFNEKILELF
jgi:hypothetical protein